VRISPVSLLEEEYPSSDRNIPYPTGFTWVSGHYSHSFSLFLTEKRRIINIYPLPNPRKTGSKAHIPQHSPVSHLSDFNAPCAPLFFHSLGECRLNPAGGNTVIPAKTVRNWRKSKKLSDMRGSALRGLRRDSPKERWRLCAELSTISHSQGELSAPHTSLFLPKIRERRRALCASFYQH